MPADESSNKLYVLIIGVSNYRGFDKSGSMDLPGAMNDALEWSRFCRTRLSVPDDQVRVLGSLVAGLAPRAPTRTNITQGLQWLASKLVDPDSAALLIYSGHGVAISDSTGQTEGLSIGICPGDVRRTLAQCMSFDEIQHILSGSGDESSAREVGNERLSRVTAILDACYGQVGPTGRARTLGTIRGSGVSTAAHRVLCRLFLSSDLWRPSYEIEIGGAWHGVFSFALRSMMERWRILRDPSRVVPYLDVSHADLCFAARRLVSDLGVAQTPVLIGEVQNLNLLPVLWSGSTAWPGMTSPTPNAPTVQVQLSGNSNGLSTYKVEVDDNGTWRPFARIISVGAVPTGVYGPGGKYSRIFTQIAEYWFYDLTLANLLSGALPPAVRLTMISSRTWSSIGETSVASIESALTLSQRLNPMFAALDASAWHQLGVGSTEVGWFGTLTVAGVVAPVGLGFTLLSNDAANWSAIGRVSWFRQGASAPSTPLFDGASSPTTTSSMVSQTVGTPPAGMNWYLWPPLAS